jgi:hypothetical protein
MNTTMTMRIFLLLFLLVLLPASAAAQDNREVLAQIRKLAQSEPTLCPDKKGCYCFEHSTKGNAPLRYAKSQFCPVKIERGRVVLLFKSWDPHGNKVDEGHYTNGEMEGLWTSWHPNGAKAAESNYTAGKQNGKFTTYHDNGKVAVQGRYTDDKTDGEWSYWDSTGKLTRKLIWDKGKLLSKQEFK